MSNQPVSSHFQEIIEQVETLPPDDQVLLIEILRQRLIQERRLELLYEIKEARQAFKLGDVKRGNVDDLMKELTT